MFQERMTHSWNFQLYYYIFMFLLMWGIIVTVWFVVPLYIDLMLLVTEMNSAMYNTIKHVIATCKSPIIPKLWINQFVLKFM